MYNLSSSTVFNLQKIMQISSKTEVANDAFEQILILKPTALITVEYKLFISLQQHIVAFLRVSSFSFVKYGNTASLANPGSS